MGDGSLDSLRQGTLPLPWTCTAVLRSYLQCAKTFGEGIKYCGDGKIWADKGAESLDRQRVESAREVSVVVVEFERMQLYRGWSVRMRELVETICSE